jgi:hypothetical protein
VASYLGISPEFLSKIRSRPMKKSWTSLSLKLVWA